MEDDSKRVQVDLRDPSRQPEDRHREAPQNPGLQAAAMRRALAMGPRLALVSRCDRRSIGAKRTIAFLPRRVSPLSGLF